MEPDTRATGRMTGNMEKERNGGLMDLSLKVTTQMVRKMVMASKYGMTATGTRDSSKRMSYRAQAFTFGKMVVDTKANGLKVACTERAHLPGRIIANMKDSL